MKIRPETLALVKSALRGVVTEARGTGRKASVEGVPVAGKTGTAQVVKMPKGEERPEEDEVPRRFRDHAWFVCYVPEPAGGLAVAVFVEHGGHGGSASAPLARKVIMHLKNLGFFDMLAGKGET